MNKLIFNYKKIEPALKSQLEAAKPTEKVRIIQDELKRLMDINGKYLGGLTPSEARLALDMLAVLNVSLSTLTAIRLQQPSPEYNQPKSHSKLPATVKTGAAASIGAAVGSILGPGGAVIGAGIGGAGATALNDNTTQTTSQHQAKAKLEVDVDTILSNLYQAFEAIDRVVTAYGKPPTKETTPKPQLEVHPELLEFLQNLMGELLNEQAQLPILTRKRIEQIPSILRHHGITAQVYELAQASAMDGSSMFDFETNLDPKITEPVTLKPVFIKDGQVILRGQVAEPVSSTPE